MVYLPTFHLLFIVNVSKYSIHGAYGGAFLRPFITIVNMPNLKDGSHDRIKHMEDGLYFLP